MSTSPASPTPKKPLRPLRGVRILSLALNLPGPAALMRCRAMGATCTKLEPPGPAGGPAGLGGDPMALYNMPAYRAMHDGVKTVVADLKSDKGQQRVHALLARTDVLITSFRPSALTKLGLSWAQLRRQYPGLSMVEIVGAPGARAEEPGHDLTYLAESNLVNGLDLPPSLYADMGGSLMTSEAVLQARLAQLNSGKGVHLEIALSEAAAYLGLPRHWGLTVDGSAVGGGHAGYKVYACKDGRVALAALEPHFAASLARLVGLGATSMQAMFVPESHMRVRDFLATRSCQELESLATANDIPLFAMPDKVPAKARARVA